MNREIEWLKVAVGDVVDAIQSIHRQRRELDARAAEIYQKAAPPACVKVIKEALREFGGENANFDNVWSRYAAAVGIDAKAVAEDALSDLPALDNRGQCGYSRLLPAGVIINRATHRITYKSKCRAVRHVARGLAFSQNFCSWRSVGHRERDLIRRSQTSPQPQRPKALKTARKTT
jgi:hypothetical protein